MTALLPLMVALPLGAAFVLPLFPRRPRRAGDLLAGLISGVLLVLAVILSGRFGIYEIGGWRMPMGINLALDGLSAPVLLLAAAVGLAAVLFSSAYLDTYAGRNRYWALLMLMTAGINGTILSGDIFNRFVFVEIAVISSYILVGFSGRGRALAAAIRYGLLGAGAANFTLLGVAVLYALHGTVNVAHLAGSVPAAGTSVPGPEILFAALLMVIGFGYKSAAAPLHVWQPDALAAAPAPVAAFLAGALIPAAGVYALARTLFTVFGHAEALGWMLLFPGLLSMLFGALTAPRRKDPRAFLSYQGISQVGYVLTGLGAAMVLAVRGEERAAGLAAAGAVFHLLNYGGAAALLFLAGGAAAPPGKPSRWSRLAGMAGAGSIAGIPPLGGFSSKLMIVAALWLGGFPLLAAAAAVTAVLAPVSFYRRRDEFLPPPAGPAGRTPPAMAAGLILLTTLVLGLSLAPLPGLRGRLLGPARAAVLDREAYAAYLEPGEEERP